MTNEIIIKVYRGDQTRSEATEVYHGSHGTIPTVGEHICIMGKEYPVWRVEHVLGLLRYQIQAHVYVSQQPS